MAIGGLWRLDNAFCSDRMEADMMNGNIILRFAEGDFYLESV